MTACRSGCRMEAVMCGLSNYAVHLEDGAMHWRPADLLTFWRIFSHTICTSSDIYKQMVFTCLSWVFETCKRVSHTSRLFLHSDWRCEFEPERLGEVREGFDLEKVHAFNINGNYCIRFILHPGIKTIEYFSLAPSKSDSEPFWRSKPLSFLNISVAG